MYKEFLISPGPTQVPQDTLLAMAAPVYHHRTERFSAVFAEASEKLKYLFQTNEDVFILTSSGTGAMEAAIVNAFKSGEKVLTINGGKFGERWTNLAKRFGLVVDEIVVEWGKSVDPNAVKEKLAADPSIKGVLVQHSETSTGALHDVKAIGAIVAKTDALLVVDAITSLGVHECKMDEWNLDIVVSGSQKAVMLPPGLAFIACSQKAWKRVEANDGAPVFYFGLKAAKKNLASKTTAFTPATTLIIGLSNILDKIKEETLEAVIARHANIALAMREGVKALGLTLFAEHPSNGVTSARAPKGIEGKKIKSTMEKKYMVSIAGSQDVEKADIFRIGHIGYYDKSDIVVCLSALEFALKDLGYAFEFGQSFKAAQEVLYTGTKEQ